MKYVCYTTSKDPWFQKQANEVAEEWSKTKGRGETTVDVVHTTPPRNPVTLIDSDGDRRFSWEWFSIRFPKGEYDGVFFHFTPAYKKKWRISSKIRGSKNTRNKDFPEFWLCTEKELAKDYSISNFQRILYHEMAHFDEELDDNNGNLLHDSLVHYMDYEKKQIHQFHYLVDYRGYVLKKKINDLMVKVISLVRNVIP